MPRSSPETLHAPKSGFDELYGMYSERIFRLAFRLLGNQEEARDATQETFFRLHQKLNGGPPLEKPKSWLYRVAVNYCSDLLKHKKLSPRILDLNSTSPVGLGPEKETELQERSRLIKNALDQLPRQDRFLIVLYMDGLSYLELAETSGIKITSVGKTLSRAVEKLACLIREGDTNEMPE